jgi:formylglycine-generating enzyme required for sulfatase activity
LRKTLAGRPPSGNWYINGQGQTLVIIRGPATFAMGSPESEPHRDLPELRHTRKIDRSFAIGAFEVTILDFRKFDPGFVNPREISPHPSSPACQVSWYDAARYCRWLTDKEGLPEREQCYPQNIGPDMKLPDDFLSRGGYRLPTDAEWEYTCRAGTMTSRFFGDDASMLGDYAWFSRNAEEHMWPVGTKMPNAWGFFDVYGNSLEWCQNAPLPIDSIKAGTPVRDDEFRAAATESRILRGGAHRYTPRDTRSAKTFSMTPDAKVSFIGFRLARTIK